MGSEEIRGMDDALIGGKMHLAVASHDGWVAVLDSQGKAVWNTNQEALRRMRAFDLNSDGNSELITGGEYGALFVYNAAEWNQMHIQGHGTGCH